ncbi:MAG: acyl-CoA dehydrogenase family protein [Fimbriimonadaceae bacterium]|nr:MAG: acyl-CoA dehydrogenase family protein [Fimbriimonadaceae bacterium]
MIASQLTEQGGSFLSQTPTSTFTPEDFSNDEKLMIQMAEDFSRKEVLSVVERLEKQEEGLMPNLIKKAGQLGFCGIDAPEEYGGLGLSKNLAARILEHLSLDASFSVTVGITSGISLFGLIAFGTEEQRQKYLPKLTSGEWIGAYALSEPNSGSDALSMSTRAEDKGDHWLLNGTKMWISNAKWANFFLVMAKIDGEHVTAFLVEKDFPGVSIAREEHKMGLKGSSTARLLLENAQIPKENLLYLPGKGHHVAFNALNMGRFKLGAMSIGPARQAIGHAAAYAQDRKQFGQPISNFGLIQAKFADMAAYYFAIESLLYRTGANIDAAFAQSDGSLEGNRAAAEEFAVECSACKVLATELEAAIVDDCLQVYGGYGFTEEFPVARIYRDARISRIYEGTNEINRIFLSDRMVRRANEGKCSLTASGDSFINDLTGKAYAKFNKDQETLGWISDLTILCLAEQSAKLRAQKTGALGQAAYERFANFANARAAGIYAALSGEAVTIPAPFDGHTSELANAVLSQKGPISF